MRESYSKDLASHAGPELYAGGGNVAGVATAGAHAGQPLCSDITRFVCRSSALTRRQHHPGRPGKDEVGTTESETLACVETPSTRYVIAAATAFYAMSLRDSQSPSPTIT